MAQVYDRIISRKRLKPYGLTVSSFIGFGSIGESGLERFIPNESGGIPDDQNPKSKNQSDNNHKETEEEQSANNNPSKKPRIDESPPSLPPEPEKERQKEREKEHEKEKPKEKPKEPPRKEQPKPKEKEPPRKEPPKPPPTPREPQRKETTKPPKEAVAKEVSKITIPDEPESKGRGEKKEHDSAIKALSDRENELSKFIESLGIRNGNDRKKAEREITEIKKSKERVNRDYQSLKVLHDEKTRDFEDKSKDYQRQVAHVNKEISTIQLDLNETRARAAKAERDFGDKSKESEQAKAEHKRAVQKYEDDFKRHKEEHERSKESLSKREKEIEEIRVERDSLRTRLEAVQQKDPKNEERIEQLSESIKSLTEQIKESKKEVEESRTSITKEKETLTAEKKSLNEEISTLRKELIEARSKFESSGGDNKLKREQLRKTVDELNSSLSSLTSEKSKIEGLLEGERKLRSNLERERREIQETSQIKINNIEIEKSTLQRQLQESLSTLGVTRNQSLALQNELASAQKERQALGIHMDTIHKTYQNVLDERQKEFNNIKASEQQIKNEFELLREAKGVTVEERKSFTAEIERLAGLKNAQETQLSEIRQEMATIARQRSNIQSDFTKLSEEVKEKGITERSLRQMLAGIKEDLETARTTLRATESNRDYLNGEYAKQKASLEEEVKTHKLKVTEVTSENSELKKKHGAATLEAVKLKIDIQKKESKIADLEEQGKTSEKLEGELATLRSNLAKAEKEKKELSEALAAERTEASLRSGGDRKLIEEISRNLEKAKKNEAEHEETRKLLKSVEQKLAAEMNKAKPTPAKGSVISSGQKKVLSDGLEQKIAQLEHRNRYLETIQSANDDQQEKLRKAEEQTAEIQKKLKQLEAERDAIKREKEAAALEKKDTEKVYVDVLKAPTISNELAREIKKASHILQEAAELSKKSKSEIKKRNTDLRVVKAKSPRNLTNLEIAKSIIRSGKLKNTSKEEPRKPIIKSNKTKPTFTKEAPKSSKKRSIEGLVVYGSSTSNQEQARKKVKAVRQKTQVDDLYNKASRANPGHLQSIGGYGSDRD